jgi:hypothetical protein
MPVVIRPNFIPSHFQRFPHYFIYILLIAITADLVLIVILAVFKRVASIYIYKGFNSSISITLY